MFYDFSSRASFHIYFLNLGTFETQQDPCEIRTQGLSSLFLRVCFPNAQAYPALPLGITSLMTFFSDSKKLWLPGKHVSHSYCPLPRTLKMKQEGKGFENKG